MYNQCLPPHKAQYSVYHYVLTQLTSGLYAKLSVVSKHKQMREKKYSLDWLACWSQVKYLVCRIPRCSVEKYLFALCNCDSQSMLPNFNCKRSNMNNFL